MVLIRFFYGSLTTSGTSICLESATDSPDSSSTSTFYLPIYAEAQAQRLAALSSDSSSISPSPRRLFDPRVKVFLDVSASESEGETSL